MLKKLTTKFVRETLEKRDYKLIDITYDNSKVRLHYICPNGHKHNIRWDHFRAGSGCPYCAKRPPITIEFVRESFNKEKYTLLTDKYINGKQKLDYICPKGHKHSITWNNWHSGYRCYYCSTTVKKSIPFIKNEFKKHNYELITENYTGHHQKLECICPNKHIYKVSWSNWNQHDSRCPKCSEVGVSVQERSLKEFINSLGVNFIENDRLIISPKELDIVIPAKKIAIEYCGLYWHSELIGKDRNYHLDKLKECEKKGYRLITIFEDEFVNNKEIVFSMLKNILGCSDLLNTFYARKCELREISNAEAKLFCERNHIQGYAISSIRLGAFHDNELVSVMTFSKPSVAKGHRSSTNNIFELSRFCCKMDTRVIGVFSKFIKYFKTNYNYNELFTYADKRWSIGNVYEKVGFDFVGVTKPNYWYFRDNTIRMHRFGFRKTSNESKEMCEWEIRKKEGLNRIWDCGNLKYNLKIR
jgi:G:T-mismatch repair DNA endonuclease (very short patch repair protein)